MSKKRVHLVCNAHLDPVWLWHWEDGLTETLSTFRVAADFCERHRGFVFNHNEALLYRWVEEYEPQLFRRIQKLVKEGRWHIAGGAYLQPDVNNASGESHIRHYLLGRRYFARHFGKLPKTGYNFDPFGHGEGFPQLLRGCGIEHYLFCRPDLGTYELPVGAFRWQDRSGSEVIARRGDDHYLTNGRIAEKLDRFLVHFAAEPDILILWGIGNHGGGPSQEEYARLKQYIKAHPEYEWIESTTDRFFAQRLRAGDALPLVRGEIQNSFPGCYTSMSRVKRGHREAESLMAAAERLSALSWWWGCAPYPVKDLDVAWKDILFSEFHDILPGSAVPSAERDSVQLLAHAREILRRQQFRALHSLISRDPRAAQNEAPVFFANPHGFAVKTQVEFEVQLNCNAWAIREPEVRLRFQGRDYPCQRLLAEANCAGNWRVRLAALVDLRPWEIARFDEYYLNDRPQKVRIPQVSARSLTFRNQNFTLKINPRTGLIDHLALPGATKSLVKPGALAPVSWADLDHSWTCGSPKRLKGHQVWSTSPGWDAKPAERFRLATRQEVAQLAPPAPDKWLGLKETSARPLRISEHGPLRTVVEAIFVCGPSALVRQYAIGHPEGSIEIRDRLFNNHRDRMLKLATPLAFVAQRSSAETLYSAAQRRPTAEHEERTNQRWVAVRGKQGAKPVFLAVLNTGSFAHSLTPGELAINVVRSPAYSSFNIDPRDERLNNRFAPRQDQGEHELRYALLVGGRFDETRVSRAAQVLNTPPVWQVYYPQPERLERSRRLAVAGTVEVDDPQVQVAALKKAEAGEELVVRLYNTSGRARKIRVQVRPFRQAIRTEIGAYGLVTLAVRRGGKALKWRRVNLVEEGEGGS
jgi:alpha-mannosidase